jgi:hypothetical protein
MKQLFIGIYSEGPTDWRFFSNLIPRCLEHVFIKHGVDIEILDPIELKKETKTTFLEEMQRLEREYSGLSAIFVHMDADGRAIDNTLERKWNPWLESCHDKTIWIPVIPIKMLESWVLANVEALERVCMLAKADILEIIGNKPPESIANPKEKTQAIVNAGKSNKRLDIETVVAKRMRLEQLEKLPSFQYFLKSIENTLLEGKG